LVTSANEEEEGEEEDGVLGAAPPTPSAAAAAAAAAADSYRGAFHWGADSPVRTASSTTTEPARSRASAGMAASSAPAWAGLAGCARPPAAPAAAPPPLPAFFLTYGPSAAGGRAPTEMRSPGTTPSPRMPTHAPPRFTRHRGFGACRPRRSRRFFRRCPATVDSNMISMARVKRE